MVSTPHSRVSEPPMASHASSASFPTSSSVGTPTTTRDGRFPLPDDFFKIPKLSAKETKYLVGLAKRACKEVVYYSRKEDGPMKWVHLSTEDGIEVHQGIDEATPDTRSLIYLRGATKIYASVDEIADFFKLDTPEKLSGFAQTVGKDLLDQQTLYNLAGPTEDNPKHYVGAKWTAVESPSKLARNRDFCYLECHDEFIDTNTKKRGWVRSIHSIRLPFCPPLDKSHGLVRGSLYRSGFIFVESSEKGCVDAIHTLHMDVKGNSPEWIKVLAMKRRIKNISQINKYFQLQRLTQSKLLGDLELPAKAHVTRCQLCETKFGLFNRKWRCRKCGKVMCTSCGHSFMIDYAGAGMKKVRICLGCSDEVVFGKLDGVAKASDAKNVKVKKLEDVEFQPIYDPSPMSGDDVLASRHLSIEEHDYYLEHEDERGIADMMEAKRMQKEFEEHLKHSHHREGNGSVAKHEYQSPQWDHLEQAAEYEDSLDDDDELGLPRSKSEQQQQKQYEDMLRQRHMKAAQQKELHAATQTISHQHQPVRSGSRGSLPRRLSREEESRSRLLSGSMLDHQDPVYRRMRHMEQNGGEMERKDSLESIRIGSDWGHEHIPPPAELLRTSSSHRSTSTSFLSVTSPVGAGAARRSDFSTDDARTSFTDDFLNGKHPHGGSRTHSFASSSRDDYMHEDEHHMHQRHSSEFASRHHTESPLFNGDQRRKHYDDPAHLEHRNVGPSSYYDPRRGDADFDARSQRHYRDSLHRYNEPIDGPELDHGYRGSPYHRALGVNGRYAGSSDPEILRRGQSRTEFDEREELAHYMAISAMKLFDQERGPGLQVSDEVRQAALSKMMAVYASEIERSTSGMMNDRRTYSAHPRHHSTPNMLRRTVSEARREPFYHDTHAPQPFSANGMLNEHAARYDRSPKVPLERSESYELGYLQHKSSPGQLQGRLPHPRDSAEDVRDLSDLSSSAFKAYQMNSEVTTGRSKSIEKQPASRHEAAHSGLRRNDSFMGRPTPQQVAAIRESLGSRHSLSTPDHPSRASGATQGSVIGSDPRPSSSSRRNSIYEDAESDTFSEVDFVELPHLMRKDYVAPVTDDRLSGNETRFTSNSFTDVHQWQDDDSGYVDDRHPSHQFSRDSIYHEGVERRLSELNPDEHIFRNSEGSECQSQSERDSLSLSSSPRQRVTSSGYGLHGAAVLSPSAIFNSMRNSGSTSDLRLNYPDDARSYSDSSSSYASEEPDYVTEEIMTTTLNPPARAQLSLSELERYRASLAELMSNYHTNSSTAGDNPQPEREPEYRRNEYANRRKSSDDDDKIIKLTRQTEGKLQEMYL